MNALLSSHHLHEVIMTLGEAECQKLLTEEKAGRRRRSILLRLHSRLNMLRAHRERAELVAIAE